MPKETWSLKSLFGLIIICLLFPFIIVVFDGSLIRYWIIHLFLSLLLITVVIFFRINKKYSSTYYPLGTILLLLYPFLVIGAYPFNIASIGIIFLLLLLGLALPFYSIKSTWWFYTLGGLTPIPKEHEWLQKKAGVANKKGLSPKEMLAYILPFVLLSYVILKFLLRSNDSLAPLVIPLISQFCTFSIALTFSTRLKRMKLFKEI
ncbi:MAG: hypothetical protein WD988_02890 [Candidatus Curtissbacteria bacterium]